MSDGHCSLPRPCRDLSIEQYRERTPSTLASKCNLSRTCGMSRTPPSGWARPAASDLRVGNDAAGRRGKESRGHPCPTPCSDPSLDVLQTGCRFLCVVGLSPSNVRVSGLTYRDPYDLPSQTRCAWLGESEHSCSEEWQRRC